MPASPDPLAYPAPPNARQDAFTFRANTGVGRHGWLRLTPAYGVTLVRRALADIPPGSVVTDPFAGTGTTPLAAAEAGMIGQGFDINPFLLWLGRAKSADHSPGTLAAAEAAVGAVARKARTGLAALAADGPAPTPDALPWVPPIRSIERWWGPGALAALAHLRAGIDALAEDDPQVTDLLTVALCRTLIEVSGAAFNHQSMSFTRSAAEAAELTDAADPAAWRADAAAAIARFVAEAEPVLATAAVPLDGSARFWRADARDLGAGATSGAPGTPGVHSSPRPADLVLTSPPYCNRMSYVRELRPYMYWTRHLATGSEAGELDWAAIGGTWGAATSRLRAWEPEATTPVDAELDTVGERIERDGGRNGPTLSAYVRRYHHDLWLHLAALLGGTDGQPLVRAGGRLVYVVGNSTFFGHEVPVQDHLAAMLRALGARDVTVTAIRKRSSKKELYEYEVTGLAPAPQGRTP